MSQVEVSLEFTPNPNTLKFVVNQVLLEKGALNYTNIEAAQNSPLASKLLVVPGVTGVMIGHNFVTVSKGDEGDWEQIHKGSLDTITGHLAAGGKVVEGEISSAPTNHTEASGEDQENLRR
jgi:hypothetical protein